MGRRGPKPQSAAQAELQGTARRKRKPSAAAPQSAQKFVPPPCPPVLEGVARDTWDWLVGELLPTKGVLPRDALALAALCQAFEEFTEATRDVHRNGRVMVTPIQNAKGDVIGQRLEANPAYAQQQAAILRLRSLCNDFELTLASRKRNSDPHVTPADQPPEQGAGPPRLTLASFLG